MSTVQVSKKRKRTDTAGGSESQYVPGSPKGQASVNSFEVPAAWTSHLQNVPATNTPPPGVLVAFAKMYHSAVAGYRPLLMQHHKITTASNRFAEESEGDSIPPAIANTLKGPTFVFSKGLSTVGEELTAEARETYTSALKVMRKAAVDYLRACHQQSVEASEALIDIESKGNCLSVDLQSYASQVIKDAGHADSNVWNAYINAVVSALGSELSSIRFDVAALVLAERQQKAAKQGALNTTAADAEMVDSAVSKGLDKQVEETDTESKKKKRKKDKPNPEPSSSKAPNASASSSKDAALKKKEKVHTEKGNRKKKGKGKKKEASMQERKGKAKSKKSKPLDA